MTTRTLAHWPRPAQITAFSAIGTGIVLAAVFAVTVLGAISGGGAGRGDNGGVGAAPSGPPSAAPSAVPSAAPSAPGETDDSSDAIPIKVDLENSSGADVHVDILDRTGLLIDAASGIPAEGQSVGPYTIKVENLDATTLKLTWVDYPIDNALALYIDESQGGVRVLLVQPEPTGPTDTVALDRELVLSFSQPVSADDVEAFLQDGLDTPG